MSPHPTINPKLHLNTYFRRLRKFRAGDYVYVSRPAATGLEPKVKRVILRVVVEKIDGTFLLQGKCGGQLIEHPDNMAPCHLEGLYGRTDSTLSSKRWACKVCGEKNDTARMLVCSGCGSAWHAECHVPNTTSRSPAGP